MDIIPNIIEKNYCDKSKLPNGEWMQEPDFVEWFDMDTGLPCLVVRKPNTFNLCGYVGISPKHKLYGSDMNDIFDSNFDGFDVHGGITFGGEGNEIIFHSRVSNETWWVGFDCAHGGDLCPFFLTIPGFSDSFIVQQSEYRTVSYVMFECGKLAKQLS
jgi:hypothetical protein